MLKPLEQQKGEDVDTTLRENNIKDFARQLEDNPILDGILIEDIVFSGAVTVIVPHKLGRKPRGYILTDVTGGLAIIARNAGAWDDKFLSLASSRACIIAIWVF